MTLHEFNRSYVIVSRYGRKAGQIGMLQLRIDPKFPEPKPVVSVTPAAAAIARKWQKGLGLAYGVAAVVYVINGWVTQSGLVGFLTAFEMEAIGFALDWLTICLAAFILVIPL